MGTINFNQTIDMLSMNSMVDFSQAQQYDPADLSSFFPKTGLTPSGFTPGRNGLTPYSAPFANDMSQYVSWNNGGNNEVFTEPSDYFPPLPATRELGMDGNKLPETADTVRTASEAPEIPIKPKRGRPRKSRAKKQLSEEQEQLKRQKFLERNRQAASKCRERRKDWISKQDEKMKGEQMKNAEMRAEYEILSQEVHNLLNVIRRHTEAGCESDHLKEFINGESSRYLASLINPARRAFDQTLMAQDGELDSASNSPREDSSEHMSRQTSSANDDKDSGITNMGSPRESKNAATDECYGDVMIP
ncbi:hypothetical protein BJ878DRAFT_8902 [Calycina marina]|uniref:BZIP domain-containing protein n=1 Tax=Calycina marina TaxID=1763456 RepID=A0A9P7Z5E6_9HELO|nr:hypothetical protein BJ878DRAFT_8902 [Calycina marina]